MSAAASGIAAQLDLNAGAAGDAVWLTSPDTGATMTWAAARGAAREIACRLDALGLAPGAPVSGEVSQTASPAAPAFMSS